MKACSRRATKGSIDKLVIATELCHEGVCWAYVTVTLQSPNEVAMATVTTTRSQWLAAADASSKPFLDLS
jgi:hypothetical protein